MVPGTISRKEKSKIKGNKKEKTDVMMIIEAFYYCKDSLV